jgi:topoisomerase-4 subunit A
MNNKLSGGTITDESIIPLVYKNYGQYSVDTQSRNIPRIEDYMISVTRRIIARIINATSLVKSAKIVGDVLGGMHPHGDSSVYGALQTIASARASFPLVQGKGNWGDLRNNRKAAAYRYTECMIHKNLELVLDDESMKRAGVYIPNFSGDSTEPYFLMTKIPIGLLNHISGIVVGVKVKTPSHNLNEVIDACIKVIEGDYNISTKSLAKIIKAPDHRLYDVNYLVDKKEWNDILETGLGKVMNQPTYNIEENCAIFTSIPYMTNIEKS